jgi:hypothetical protein
MGFIIGILIGGCGGFVFTALFIGSRRTGGRCANTSTNSQRDEILLCDSVQTCEDREHGRCTYLDGACRFQRKT